MKKKLFLLILMLYLTCFSFTSIINNNSTTTAVTYKPEYKNFDALADFSNSTTLGNNESMSIYIGALTHYHYIVWNVSSSATKVFPLLMNVENYAKFNLGTTCSFIYLIDHLTRVDSLTNEPKRIAYDDDYYVVFWNDNTTTTTISAEVSTFELKIVILECTLEAYDRNDDKFMDSIRMHYKVNFNYNIETEGGAHQVEIYDDVTMTIEEIYGGSPWGNPDEIEIWVDPTATEFVIDIGSKFARDAGFYSFKLRSYFFYQVDDPFNNYDDLASRTLNEELYSVHEGETRLQKALFIVAFTVGPMLLISIPISIFFINKAVKKKKKLKQTES
ncbi:MAG: hypothetical protein ACTSSK_06800 [Candidatus Heimdallarchaeota archaeon]